MSNNYKFLLSYDGTRYYGWEHQPDTDMTIQGKIENVLTKMTESESVVEVIGCGRTDAGVHAKGMVCNARLNTNMDVSDIRDYMNHYLPDDICVREVGIASDRFHSRYNAVGKTYEYTCYIGDTKPMFNRKFVFVPVDHPEIMQVLSSKKNDISQKQKPDIALMKRAAEYLMGEHDFAAFCSNPRMKKSTVRKVDTIDIEQRGDYLHMTFHGTGFLQHMVRILTGTLLEVGYGKREPENMLTLIDGGKRADAGFTAPAKGLCMIKVDY